MHAYEARGEPEEDRESEPGLLELLGIVRRRMRLILAVTVLAGTTATGVSFLLPNRYEAVATVQIDQRNKKIVDIEGVLSDLKADTATVESEVEVIRSKTVVQRVIEILDLRSDPEFTSGSISQRWLERLGPTRTSEVASAARAGNGTAVPRHSTSTSFIGADRFARDEPERDEVAQAFDSRLKVSRVRNTLVIEIRFSAADPVKAARIANTLAAVYLRAQIEAKIHATELASSLLEDKIRGLRDKVAEAERNIERFKADNNIFDADGHLLADRQLAREMEALVLARNHTAQVRARYEQARRMMLGGEGNEAVAEVLQSHTVRMLRDELTKALRRQAELGTKYGVRHPEMQKVAADVAKAQSELGAEIGKIIRNLKTEYEVAADRERQLTDSLEALKEQISSSKEKQWQLRELEREAAASKQLYEALLSRNKQTAETLGLQLPDARIVERADVPLERASPKRKQIVLIATAGGLALGLGLALLLELTARGVQRPEDVEELLHVPHLASMPLLEAPDSADPSRSIRLMLAAPHAPFAEAVRGLRHEIDAQSPYQTRRIILIASSLPNEGKTVIASNLAHHYAVTGVKTLLIDADLRRAVLTRQLGLAPCPGLLEAIVDAQSIEQAILRDSVSGLHFLPARSVMHRQTLAAEVLGSKRAVGLLTSLREEFEIIVIDAPPLLPVVDARVVAGHADQIAFVMTWKRTPKALAKRAMRGLGANARKVVGVVVNQVEPGEDALYLGYALGDGEPIPTHDRRAA